MFLPGKSLGQRSLVGYSPWSHKVGHGWAHEHRNKLKHIPVLLICLSYRQPCSQSTSLLLGLLLQPSAWSLSIYKLTSLQFILHVEPEWFFFQCEIISHSSLNSFNCFPSQLVWDSDSFSLSQEPSRIQTLSVSLALSCITLPFSHYVLLTPNPPSISLGHH